MATQHFGFAARTPSWISDASRLPISTIPASIIALACVNIVTLLVVVGLKYRHLLFRHSYPSKVSLSPAVSHLEPLPEKHNEPSSIPPTSQLPELDIASPFPDLARPEATQAQREQMAKDKQLYHELQNLEDHPGAADRARKRLVELLDRTVHEAKATPSSGIISIERYTPSALRQFFQSGHTANSLKYEAYIQRRRAGGPREIFPTYEYAVQWLKLAACVKYVDGSWVSNVLNMGIRPVDVGTSAGAQGGNKRSAHAEREAAKLAWQVITEEFGDGDIEKNHVHLYYELIRSLDPTAQPGNVSGFDGLAATEGAHRCWTAAIAQQCVGLMAGTDDFSPEALGFNMAYETLPYHLLVTSCELRELEIDDYYFALHITIDNPDSGHAALARVAVETFLEGIRERDGAEAMHAMWRRVQAGVILADGLPTTPAGPVEHERCPVNGLWRPKTLSTNQVDTPPASAIEAEMTRLLTRKSLAAEKMHCSSRIRIEGLTVEKWLDPASWNNTKALDFLRALGRKRPWVVPGDKANSRLVRELEWGGRMFGAFSAKETDLVRRWIGQLGQGEGKEVEREVGAYARFVGPLAGSATSERDDDDAGKGRYARYASKQLLTVSEEEVSQVIARLPASPSTDSSSSMADMHARAVAAPLSTNPAELATLWFTLPALLEHFPLSPSKLASPLGMCTLRVLRSFSGFPDLHAPETICAGMDHVVGPTHLSSDMTDTSEEGVEDTRGWAEIGYELFDITPGLERDHASSKAVGSEMEGMSADMLALRSRPYAHADILLGMTYAGVHRIMADASFLQQVVEADKAILERIQAEVRVAIEEYMASPAGRDVVGMEGFLRGYERVMTAAI